MRAARLAELLAERRRLGHSVCIFCQRQHAPAASPRRQYGTKIHSSLSVRAASAFHTSTRVAAPDNSSPSTDSASSSDQQPPRPARRFGGFASVARDAATATGAPVEGLQSASERREREALARVQRERPTYTAPRLDDPKLAPKAPRKSFMKFRKSEASGESDVRRGVWRPGMKMGQQTHDQTPEKASQEQQHTPPQKRDNANLPRGNVDSSAPAAPRQYKPRYASRTPPPATNDADNLRATTFRALNRNGNGISSAEAAFDDSRSHKVKAKPTSQEPTEKDVVRLDDLDDHDYERPARRTARRDEEDDERDEDDARPARRGQDQRVTRRDTSGRSGPSSGFQRDSKSRDMSRRSQKFEDAEEPLDEEDIFDEDWEDRRERKKRRKARKAERDAAAAADAPKTTIELPAFISVQALATALRVRPDEFVEKLGELGFEDVAMDHVLNYENAALVAMEYGHEPSTDQGDANDIKPREAPADPSVLPPRPPVVTIMGHVDHGKTTLLDYLRKTAVAAGEHGGITQHIGAFSVPIASAGGRLVTFLDTPGHAAFLSMRQRGATVTDIVVLVVAADDSVKPQTIEAIKHARAAGVQLIVAVSKVDKEGADPARVKSDLLQHDVEVEDLGGSIQAIEVSGKTGAGVAELEEALLAQADVLDLRADADGPPEGWVLEATTRRSGRAATVLVRRGTLRPGDIIVAGTTWARARTLVNEAGVRVDAATPGTPVEVDGWREQPAAGDEVLGAPSESRAAAAVDARVARRQREQAGVDMDAINAERRAGSERRAALKQADEAARQHIIDTAAAGAFVRARALNEAGRAAREDAARTFDEATNAGGARGDDGVRTLYLVVKADVSGSAEAAVEAIAALPTTGQPVRATVLRAAAGAISESDLALVGAAPAGDALLVNFGQELAPATAAAAERAGVPVLDARVIYALADGVRAALEARLPPLVTRRVLGEAEAAAAFDIRLGRGSTARVAGCRVKNGTLARAHKVRVFRGGVGGQVVFEGRMAGLRIVKRDVAEVRKGSECGVQFEDWDAFEEGDVLQCFEEISEPRKLPSA